jgi:DNA-binding CsgD family transcriptional regulator
MRRPEHSEFFYYELRDDTAPQIAVGFARHKKVESDNSFTANELAIFEELRPHILTLFRTVLTVHMLTEKYQYFDTLSILGSRISDEFHLSEAEIRLIPDILVGHTNEKIAEQHFISIATVKTHIHRILKKTGTKNRVDFISKFFTNPELSE